MNVIAVG